MTASHIVDLAACACQLALSLFCVARAARSPLAVPLALLCLDVFGWTSSGLAYDLSGVAGWHWLDHALTPWTAPLALQFVLVFVGRLRALRPFLWGSFLACSLLSAASLLAFLSSAVRPFIGSDAWSVALMSVALPVMGFAVALLLRHLRESTLPIERTRTRLLLAAFCVGTALGATEEVGKFIGVSPQGATGMLASTALLSVVAFRLRLFERGLSVRAATLGLSVTAVCGLASVAVLRHIGPSLALPLLVAGILSLALLVLGRRWLSEEAVRRSRNAQLATLGRLSAQMTHDMRNPLSALKGAAQVLEEDLSRHETSVDRHTMVQIMLDQIGRLENLVDLHGRIGRLDPAREAIDLNDLVRTALALQSMRGDTVRVTADLDEALPRCRLDPEMVARALENLVRNAIEAMPTGGTVTVRTAATPDEHGQSVTLSVEDTGCGMDARTRERAFDDYFTTKAGGSGLGLPFVRRVAEAHGGRVVVESQEGRGTVVRVHLPSG
jgi:signal transduction histidine kinase